MATRIQGHEHVRTRLLLHAPQLAATVSGDPAFAALRDTNLCSINALGGVGNRDAAPSLLQQPLDELSAAASLLHPPGNESNVAYILQDRARRKLELLACHTLLAKRIAEFIIAKDPAVCVKTAPFRGLFAETLCEETRVFGLHTAHDLEF